MSKPPQSVLFICTGNICRSTLAEYMFRKMLADAGLGHVRVFSAGVAAYPDTPSPAEALKTLKARGLDGASHKAQLISGELIDQADLILTMEAGHQMAVVRKFPRAVGKTYVLKSFAGAEGPRDVPDPMGEDLGVFEVCAVDIEGALKKLLEKVWKKK